MAMATVDTESQQRAKCAPVAEVVAALAEILGPQLTAIVAGVDDPTAVGAWARGEGTPLPEAERRLRDALTVADMLREYDDPVTVRAWFSGLNPELNDRLPALVIGEEPDEVLLAAHTFIAHG